MELVDASNLIRAAVTRPGGTWADLGAGSGTFTSAVARLLGEGGVVYAVDRVAGGLAAGVVGAPGAARVVPVVGDLREPLPLADLAGVVMANSLHFVAGAEQADVLTRVVSYLRPEGVVVLVEYDQRRGSPWVPFPVPLERFEVLAAEAGLAVVKEIGRRRSRFGPRDIYAAVAGRS